DQPSCQQTALTEKASAVLVTKRLLLIVQIERPRRGRTPQAHGPVISSDVTGCPRTRTTGKKLRFHFAQQVEPFPHTLGPRGSFQVIHLQRSPTAPDNQRGMTWAEKAGGHRRLSEGPLRRDADKTWQVRLCLRQFVGHQRPQRREADGALR